MPVASESIKTFRWINPQLASEPNHFEDLNLERYGHSHRVQLIHSMIRFGTDVATWPIHRIRHHDFELVDESYLGRPGDPTCAVKKRKGHK